MSQRLQPHVTEAATCVAEAINIYGRCFSRPSTRAASGSTSPRPITSSSATVGSTRRRWSRPSRGCTASSRIDRNSNRYKHPVVRYLTTTTTTTTLLLLLLLLCLPPLLLPYPGEGSLRALPRRTGHLRRGDEGKRHNSEAIKQVASHDWLTHHLLTQTLICTCYCDEGGLREEGCCRAGDAPHDNMNTM